MSRSTMSRKARLLIGAACVWSGASLLPCLAHAQASGGAGANSTQVGEVIVTARRVGENIQKVPVAETALSPVKLEANHVVSLLDLNVVVPGLHISTYSGMDSQIVAIRGQRNSQVQPGQDPSIGVYFADVPTGFQFGMNLGMFDLSSVQVLKGPQGVLFGRNSTGGAILIDPQKPTDTFQGFVRVGVEDFYDGTGVTTTAVVNLPLAKDLNARFALDTVNQDGWEKNIANPATVAADSFVLPKVPTYHWPWGTTNFDNLGAQASQTVRASLDWDPTSNFDNLLVAQNSQYGTNGLVPSLTMTVPGEPLAGFYASVVARQLTSNNYWSGQTAYNEPIDLNQTQVADTVTWKLGSVTIKNIAGYKIFDRLWANEAIGSPLGIGLSAALEYHMEGTEYSEELQASGAALDDKLTWITGAFYFHNIFSQSLFGSAFGWDDRYTPEALSTTLAGYGHGSYKITDALSLSFGARYTNDFRSMNKFQYGGTATTCTLTTLPAPNPAVAPPNCYFYAGRTFNDLTYDANLSYQFDPATLIYLTNSTGYRAGGFNIAQSDLEGYQKGYQPEKVTNYEIGLKRDWQVGSVPVRTDIAAYYQDYTNIVRELQQVEPGGATFAVLTNGPRAVIPGAEAEITIRPTKDLHLDFSYSYVDPRYTAAFYPIPGVNVESNQFALIPHTTVNATVIYDLPVDPRHGLPSISATYYYQSRMWYDDTNQGNFCGPLANLACGPLNYYSQQPYGLLDLRADWKHVEGSNVDVDLWVTNATDTKYNTSAGAVVGSLGFENVMGLPRFIGIDVKYHFNGG